MNPFHFLAQTTPATETASSASGFLYFLTILLCTIGPFVLGIFLAKRLRMNDDGWRFGLVLTVLVCAAVLSFTQPPQWGVDLKGGVILNYEVDLEATKANNNPSGEEGQDDTAAAPEFDIDLLVLTLKKRVNPGGEKDVVVRSSGSSQVEVIVPAVESADIDHIKQLVETAGVLNFRIMANRFSQQGAAQAVFDAAEAQAADPLRKLNKYVFDADGNQIGLWTKMGRDNTDPDIAKLPEVEKPLVVNPSPEYHLVRNGNTGDLIFNGALGWEGLNNIEVLMRLDEYGVEGKDLSSASPTTDENARPAISFTLNAAGTGKFANLTRENINELLCITLDNQLVSAANIESQIVGNGIIHGVSRSEAVSISEILKAGRLPAVLKKTPISENQISALLGKDTIEKGKYAIGASMICVLIFMVFYYRFAGIVACFALLANLLLVYGLLILIQASLTLPGLAGLVLTVGMSVDANVLIFERIREELNKGSSLRLAIANGFGRATTTIVDANLTTLITGIILYGIGTEAIKGFAITLILGILVSMFTAIFCARLVFDLGERLRLYTKLSMLQILGNTAVDFIGKRKIAGFMSIVLIFIGMGAVYYRGAGLFDIDFNGGTSVHVLLTKSQTDKEIRTKLQDNLSQEFKNSLASSLESEDLTSDRKEELSRLEEISDIQFSLTMLHQFGDQADGTAWKIDTSITDAKVLEDTIKNIFSNELVTHQVKIDVTTVAPKTTSPETESKPETVTTNSANETTTDKTETEKEAEKKEEIKTDATEEKLGWASTTLSSSLLATTAIIDSGQDMQNPSKTVVQEKKVVDEQKATETKEEKNQDDTQQNQEVTTETTAQDQEALLPPDLSTSQPAASAVSQAKLEFESPISVSALLQLIENSAKEANVLVGSPVPYNEEWAKSGSDQLSRVGYKEWSVDLLTDGPSAQKVFDQLKQRVESSPVFPATSKFGSKVAGDAQVTAITAIITSLIGIILYIWIRFQRVTYGIAAVIALVHDVLITLGAIAVSLWLSNIFGFLQIEEFKISLPIVAAFLTIIGYSLNDTIVVFDRIREVRGKNPDLSESMINQSLNQTLGRTLLTSITTLLVVLILYFFGGQGIHGFAFALLIGVMVGTYSSIFIASPALLWLTNRKNQ